MIDFYLSVEQEKREKQDLDAINEIANRNTELESYGNWDGLLNEPPQEKYWSELPYREGYLAGIARYYNGNIALA
ncbi:MAG: hypothetical protein QNJ34_20445 [Xenococcaceae cyanobacterium MO_188.B29]|nr:hypothetical protein [Xenococcaceae cyanobacterium MO_188.B29]